MCICNATQRNAYHHYILNNNFKFYIFQFFRAVNFLSVSFLSFIKEKQNLCSLFVEKKNHANPKGTQSEGGQSSKTISFCQKEDKAKARFQRKTTPFRIHNSVFIGLSQFIENQFAIFNYAFSYALKNNFEIISRNENYAFNHNKYFCRNGNNRIGKSISHSPKASYGNEAIYSRSNPIFLDCFTSFAMTSLTVTIYFLAMIMAESLFLVLGIILIVAFYLIEKLKKINLCQRFSVGEGEQK